MTMMKIAVNAIPPERAKSDLLAIPAFEDKDLFQKMVNNLKKLAGVYPPQIGAKVFSGKKGQTLLVHSTVHPKQFLLVVGMGKRSDLTQEQLRRMGALATSCARSVRAKTVACLEPDTGQVETPETGVTFPPEEIAQTIVEGALLAAYRYDKYQTQNPEEKFTPTGFALIGSTRSRVPRLIQGAKLAHILCNAVYLVRDLANAPGNEITPDALARHARAAGRGSGVAVTVLNERRIARLGMGGLLGVAQGSACPPRFIIMDYKPRTTTRHVPTIVLVGKGVTFDSGGISIKPSANMAEMKMDMSGAAAVIGTVQAVAKLALPIHLVGLIPATENLPGGRALKPGDILKHLNGMTSEIDNTDAEGRLILADALVYAARYSPDLVIDLATLTGAVVVALGHVATGMLGTAQHAMRQVEEAGLRTYERVWQLPLFEEYERLIKSDVADVKNTGGRWAGAITGALFLKKFTGTYPWVHLDIAGTAITEEATEYTAKGGSGVGVRLLVDLLRHWKNY
jgi:leucyl aminopeptidase